MLVVLSFLFQVRVTTLVPCPLLSNFFVVQCEILISRVQESSFIYLSRGFGYICKVCHCRFRCRCCDCRHFCRRRSTAILVVVSSFVAHHSIVAVDGTLVRVGIFCRYRFFVVSVLIYCNASLRIHSGRKHAPSNCCAFSLQIWFKRLKLTAKCYSHTPH